MTGHCPPCAIPFHAPARAPAIPMTEPSRTFLGHLIHRWRASLKAERERHALLRRFPSLLLQEGVQVVAPRFLKAGRNVEIHKGTILHCGGRSWTKGGGFIQLGDEVIVGPHGYFLGAGGITVGDRVRMGGGVMVFSSEEDFSLVDGRSLTRHLFAPIVIEEDVIVGSQAVITPGVRIGRGALIGAGALVRKDLPPYSVALGRPAEVVGDRRKSLQHALRTKAEEPARAPWLPAPKHP